MNAALGDLNGDGKADLVLGISYDKSIKESAGSVLVMFGSSKGLTTSHSLLLSQNTAGVLGNAKTGDQFGAAVSITDRTGDGIADLAVGVPGEVISTHATGALTLFTGHTGSTFSTAGSVTQSPAYFGFSLRPDSAYFGQDLP